MSTITVIELQRLKSSQHGQRISLGKSMFGSIRAGSDGTVSVYVSWRYRIAGKLREIPIGTWRDKTGRTLKSLRDEVDCLAQLLKSGVDPIEHRSAIRLKAQADELEAHQQQLDRVEQIAELQARVTVRGLFDLWHDLALKRRNDKGSEALRAFTRDVFPIIGDVAAADITKAHIQKVVDTMMERDVVRMTKRVLSDLRQMFGFALDRDLIRVDPTARIKKASIGKEMERERALTEHEITLFSDQLPLSGLSRTSQLALLIQLSTLTRIGEVVSAEWKDIDLKQGLWTLPSTKNERAHYISLSKFARRQFEGLHEITGKTRWTFPNSALEGPLDRKTITKQVADRQRDGEPMTGRTKHIDALVLPGGPWRPHDLRRTGASRMADLGVPPDIIERCLNHTEQNKMKRIYQRAAYETPMKEAWDRWGARLCELGRGPLFTGQ